MSLDVPPALRLRWWPCLKKRAALPPSVWLPADFAPFAGPGVSTALGRGKRPARSGNAGGPVSRAELEAGDKE